MRLYPDTMAARIGWLLAIGLILTVAATFLVSGWSRTSSAIERIATLAMVANRAPAAARPALVPALSEPGVAVTWAPDATPPPMSQDFMSRHLARDIRVALESARLDRVEAGHVGAAGGSDVARANGQSGALQVWIGLTDGTWLTVTVESELVAALWTPRFVLTLAVLIAGIVLLAVWATRRVTAALGRFAALSQRLGTDVNAPPVCEVGPSEIRQAARAFNQMQRRIRRLVEDRTLMLAAISHDLRTALTRLKLRTDFIGNPEQRAKALADLDGMQAMLDSTLSLARDDASTEATTRVDLAALLQSLCDDLSDAGKPVTYEGPPRLVYSGRPVALRRMFANLVDNAIAYGEEAAVTMENRDELIQVTIGDRGPGIPETFREQVFAPFYRLEPSRSRETGGTGLGLTIARTIVHRHGGSILLEDRPGGGLLVRVTLPRVTV
jgi:signal transduction histidine kinase